MSCGDVRQLLKAREPPRRRVARACCRCALLLDRRRLCVWSAHCADTMHAIMIPGGPGCGLQSRSTREGERFDSSLAASRPLLPSLSESHTAGRLGSSGTRAAGAKGLCPISFPPLPLCPHAIMIPGGPGCGLQSRSTREGERFDSSLAASRILFPNDHSRLLSSCAYVGCYCHACCCCCCSLSLSLSLVLNKASQPIVTRAARS